MKDEEVMKTKERRRSREVERERERRRRKSKGEMRCDEWGMPDRVGGETRHDGSIFYRVQTVYSTPK